MKQLSVFGRQSPASQDPPRRRGRWRQRVGIVLALLLLPTMVFFAACGGDDDDNGDDLEKVTLMLNWTPNTQHAGIYLAQAKGWYREAGIDLGIIEPAQAGVEQVVATGNAQFGISVQEGVIPAREQGIPIVSIAAIMQHNDSSFFALGSDNITRPKDFEGKTYGGYGGPLEAEILNTLVQCDGGDPSTVKHIEVGNIDYLAGMEQDRFDFVWVFEGWDALRAREVENIPVTSVRFADHLDCIPDWYTPVIITNESMIADRPETVRKFMEATARGYAAAIEDSQAAADALLEAASELDRELVELSARYHTTHYVDEGRQWGLQDEATWTTFEAFLREAGLTSKEIDVQAAFTNEFLPNQ
ncbi:MAG: ABC transporter substrate-binding protein [Dehalococcoidia bacterium]|nr:ABC transporter substrate-binding protein [Dehalococcoidia bacterium]